jgi:hypothetical protein
VIDKGLKKNTASVINRSGVGKSKNTRSEVEKSVTRKVEGEVLCVLP